MREHAADLNSDAIRRSTDLPQVIDESWCIGGPDAEGDYRANCPFCEGDDESLGPFVVSRVEGMYVCMQCGMAGDIYQWLMRYRGLSWPRALREAAEYSKKYPTRADAVDRYKYRYGKRKTAAKTAVRDTLRKVEEGERLYASLLAAGFTEKQVFDLLVPAKSSQN